MVRVVCGVSTSERCVDPVVSDALVGVEDDRVTLTSKNLYLVATDGVSVDAISFDDREIMAVNREVVGTTSGLVDDTETVTSVLYDVDNSEGNRRTAIEPSDAVDSTGISDRDDVAGCEGRKRVDGIGVPPVGQLNDRVDVVNVIQMPLRILRVVDDQRSTEPIDVLDAQLTVVPESSCLVGVELNVLSEGATRSDRALSDERLTLKIIGRGLNEDTVQIQRGNDTHGGICKAVVDGELEPVTLVHQNRWRRELSIGHDSTSGETIGSQVPI